jgi:hypothetical protein
MLTAPASTTIFLIPPKQFPIWTSRRSADKYHAVAALVIN